MRLVSVRSLSTNQFDILSPHFSIVFWNRNQIRCMETVFSSGTYTIARNHFKWFSRLVGQQPAAWGEWVHFSSWNSHALNVYSMHIVHQIKTKENANQSIDLLVHKHWGTIFPWVLECVVSNFNFVLCVFEFYWTMRYGCSFIGYMPLNNLSIPGAVNLILYLLHTLWHMDTKFWGKCRKNLHEKDQIAIFVVKSFHVRLPGRTFNFTKSSLMWSWSHFQFLFSVFCLFNFACYAIVFTSPNHNDSYKVLKWKSNTRFSLVIYLFSPPKGQF